MNNAAETLGKAINAMASSFKALRSTQFVYTPTNASTMRDPNFILELIKVRIIMFDSWTPIASVATSNSCKSPMCRLISKALVTKMKTSLAHLASACCWI